jgi:hypothetical protein
VLYRGWNCLRRGGGIGLALGSDRRQTERAGDGDHPDNFVQRHGDSPLSSAHHTGFVMRCKASGRPLAETLRRSSTSLREK